MELGLFLDSPGLVLRAQRDLLRENVRFLRLVMLPAAILALLFALLYSPMSAMYGRAPLPVGEPSVVTIQMKDAAMPPVQFEAPDGIVVETPGVRSPSRSSNQLARAAAPADFRRSEIPNRKSRGHGRFFLQIRRSARSRFAIRHHPELSLAAMVRHRSRASLR